MVNSYFKEVYGVFNVSTTQRVNAQDLNTHPLSRLNSTTQRVNIQVLDTHPLSWLMISFCYIILII